MGIFNLLSAINPASGPPITFLGGTYDISLNWLGKLIRLLIEGIGVVGVGIIVFSVLLRVIVLPFDVYQRVSMRKQNIKMEANKEQLEKLQKQYANDKAMYNQKMMEMYKANGISMFSSCLPMIISLVIFIVAINAFNAFSQYSNLQNYNLMANAYNEEMSRYRVEAVEENISVYETEKGEKRILVYDENEDSKIYIYYTLVCPEDYEERKGDFEYIKSYIENTAKNYYVDVDRTYADFKSEIDEIIENSKVTDENGNVTETSKENACVKYFQSVAQDKVLEVYKTQVTERMGFGWVKNIWTTDATFKHPVLKYSDFKSTVGSQKIVVNGVKTKFSQVEFSPYDEASYNLVTEKLDAQKKEANGYYILIALSIGTILLQQFISMKSQKAQSQYSSVDGQGASQQKMMLVLMPLIFAVFSFMYSAAFSIYMITSNILSIIMTLVINKVVDVVMTKKEEQAMQEQYNKRFPGRTYVPEKERNKQKKNRNAEEKKGGKKH